MTMIRTFLGPMRGGRGCILDGFFASLCVRVVFVIGFIGMRVGKPRGPDVPEERRLSRIGLHADRAHFLAGD